jgi:glycosyltransferase involved in cell wall biosynthesis
MVLVSVVMPSYNHADYIPQAIESVLTQNFQDIELIIIDDCSKDNSRDLILSYKKKDARIRTIFHEKNLGIADTYNDGLDAAEGKYVAILDSDDVWRRNKLEKQLSILGRNEDLVVWSEGRIIDRVGKPTGQTFTQIQRASRRRKSGDIFQTLLSGNFIFDSSLIVKKSNVDGIRFDHNLKYLNDYKFVVDLAKDFKYCFINEQLVDYRIHGKNTITRDQESWLQDEIIMRKYFLGKYNMERQIKSQMFFQISLAYSRLGKNKLGRQFLVMGLSQKAPIFAGFLYIIALANSFIGTFLLRVYDDLHSYLKK